MQEAAFGTLHFLTKLICSYLIVAVPLVIFKHMLKVALFCFLRKTGNLLGKLFVSYTLNIYFTLPKQKLK